MSLAEPTLDDAGPVLGSPRSRAWDEPTGLRLVARYALLVVIAVVVMAPVYLTLLGAVTPASRVIQNRLVPGELTLSVFVDAWTEAKLGRFLLNSTVVALTVTLAQLITSLLSGYAFANLRFPGRKVLYFGFLSTLLVPFEATVVANIDTVQRRGERDGILAPLSASGGLDSLRALALPFLATAVGTFLVRQAILDLPQDLVDASRLDGLGHVGFIRRVALPLVRPTLAALALFSFLSTWNQYLWPRLVISTERRHTVQSGLQVLQGRALDEPNLVLAGTVIAALPILAAIIGFQRHLVRGLTAGAVKG